MQHSVSPDTCVVSSSGLDSAREALRANEPERLLGLAECDWLDVKGGVYVLDQPYGAEELLKDVAAFANAKAGGLLLVGFSTRVEHGEEIVDQIRPVPREQVDLDRYRKLLERITPTPMYVAVDWIDRGDAKGILFIDVPAQPPACLPYLVPGPARSGKNGQQAGALPVRDGDRTRWLTVPDLQRLLAAGWSQKGGHSEEVLRDLISQTVAAARAADQPTVPVIQPGEGDPVWARRFEEVATALCGRIKLGAAAGRVYHEGPGPVQHFAGRGREAWLLCAVPGHKPVMVAEPVWEWVREAGSGAPGADAFTALGFPVLGKDVLPAERFITPLTDRVELAGGAWGPGFVVSSFPYEGYHWEAAPQFSFTATPEGTSWTGGPPVPQLRVRAAAFLPVAGADRQIKPYQADRLAGELQYTDLALAAQGLSERRGASLPAVTWQPGRTGRSTDRCSFVCPIAAPDGTPALAAEVMLSMTGGSPIVAIAELRIEDAAAWEAALLASEAGTAARSQMPLSLRELWTLLAAAWRAVTHDLPAVLAPDLTFGPFSRPPLVELRLSAEQPSDQIAAPYDLTDLIDFSPLGSTDRRALSLMTVTISGPVRLSDEDRRKRTREAIAFMAQGFGFSEPDGDLLSAW